MLADIASARRQGHALFCGPLLHQPVMLLLVGSAFTKGFEATDTRLVFNAFPRGHELPTPGIVFAGTPRTTSLDSDGCRD